ncbi:hypothetical protein Aau02nite_59030 [Amorphoplanes auranticolor]|uniref:Uncharacterized protein n=1 Tax=Actinoplanes auranticolor TaxID=47988 RepID=A0A919VSC2_9ACTN|nr:hypothetical protein Aau02nite_59030 [Actinoplanes auranticolor]
MSEASVPDLLADETSAQAWLDGSLRPWGEQTGRVAPTIAISGDDLAALCDLRGHVRGRLTNETGNHVPHPVAVEVSLRDGRLARHEDLRQHDEPARFRGPPTRCGSR